MNSKNVWKYPIKAAIFDVDGTLLDSTQYYYQANKIMSGDPNFPFSFQKRLSKFSGNNVANEIIKAYNLDMTPEIFLQKRRQILYKLLPSSTLISGVEPIVRSLHKMKIPMAVGTSAWNCNHKIKTSKLKKFFSLFDATVCGDEVKQVKPSPEIFQVASSKLGNFSPENVLIFENEFNGIKAACLAKMPSVLLCDDDQDFIEGKNEYNCQPTLRIHNYEEFSFEYFVWESS